MVKVAVVGARGYLGRELVRLLTAHPNVEAVVTATTSQPGGVYAESVPAYGRGGPAMVDVTDPVLHKADVVFLATAGGEAKKLAPTFGTAKAVIDLSRDHRDEALHGKSPWVYGLGEPKPMVKKGTKLVANPGCYPTASLLALAPALAAGLVAGGPIIVDGISGVTGAGATPRPDLHYADTNESVRAYKTLGHDHEAEIQAGCTVLGKQALVRFTPHLAPLNRGLLATVHAPLSAGVTPGDVKAAYEEAYAATPFVQVVAEADTTHVRGTNRAEVAVDVHGPTHLLVARCAIDNLLKGGAGAAVQNMNLLLGLPPTSGLPLIGGAP